MGGGNKKNAAVTIQTGNLIFLEKIRKTILQKKLKVLVIECHDRSENKLLRVKWVAKAT